MLSQGRNLLNDVKNAEITDKPGGLGAAFILETVAHSDELGINYGSVRWSFKNVANTQRGGSGTQYIEEKCEISATPSSDFKESMIAFNKFYKNKHIVQAGETLYSISIDYYGDSSNITSIYFSNKQVLATAIPDALIPVGTELEMPPPLSMFRGQSLIA